MHVPWERNQPFSCVEVRLSYTDIAIALQEAGVSGTATRDKWPLEVLKKVLQGLEAEVPSQLLARELFCGAISSADWLQCQKAFTSSAAVMSMVEPNLLHTSMPSAAISVICKTSTDKLGSSCCSRLQGAHWSSWPAS